MKHFFLITALACCTFASFAQKDKKAPAAQDTPELIYRGEKINDKNVITTAELVEKMKGAERLEAKVVANIVSVCQKKGCWMMVDLGNGQLMRVTFKNYGFFVPLDCAGKTVVMQGAAYYETVSVEMLRHYAEDEGQSEEEIAAITEPEKALAFEATGLFLK